eukprot:1157464-Pelagomonas_calceolata.AAC.1
MMPKMTCRTNSVFFFKNAPDPRLQLVCSPRLKLASLFSGPLSHPSLQMAPYLPAIRHVQSVNMLFFMMKDDKCWTAQFIQAFQGLRGADTFEQAVRQGGAISMDDFSADMRYKLQGVWGEAESVDHPRDDPRGNNNKLATYQAGFATPFACNARQTYVSLPWYLFLDLPKQVMRNVSRFRLRAHTLQVESAIWQGMEYLCVT